LVLMTLECSSCQKRQERTSLPVEVWDGKSFLRERGLPVSIVWFRGPGAELPHKGFCHAKEIKEIVDRLLWPEIPGSPPDMSLVPETRNLLCLSFFEAGQYYVSRVVVVDFDIDKNGVFLGPRGKSPALGKLLQEKEESGLKGYSVYGSPDTEEEMIDRSETIKRYMQDHQKRYEEAVARYEILGVTHPFELVDITIDDLLKDTPNSFDGVLIRRSNDPDPNHVMAIAGELRSAQPIVGHKINADKILGYPWPIRIFEGFQKADRVKLPAMDNYQYEVIFLNGSNRKGYRIKMAVDKKYVYGAGYRSKQLRKDFAKRGLFETK